MYLIFSFVLSLLFVSVISDGAFDRYQRKVSQVRQRLVRHQPGSPPKESRKIKRYKCVEEVVEVFDEQPYEQPNEQPDEQPPPPSVIIDDSKLEFEPNEQPKGEPHTAAQSPKVHNAPKIVHEPTTDEDEPKPDEDEPKAAADNEPQVRIDIPEPKVNRVKIDVKARPEATKEELNNEQVEAPTTVPQQSVPHASLPNDAPRARAIKVQKPQKVVGLDPRRYQLAEVQCNAIKATASTYRVKDVTGWVRKNCVIAKMYLPSATCEELNMYVDSCFPK